jgi:hypothetical protein
MRTFGRQRTAAAAVELLIGCLVISSVGAFISRSSLCARSIPTSCRHEHKFNNQHRLHSTPNEMVLDGFEPELNKEVEIIEATPRQDLDELRRLRRTIIARRR